MLIFIAHTVIICNGVRTEDLDYYYGLSVMMCQLTPFHKKANLITHQLHTDSDLLLRTDDG